MGFFKNFFGQDDDQLEYNDSYDSDNDYDDDIDLDDDDVDLDDDDIDLEDYNDDSSDSSDKSYSIAKVHVLGFDQLDEADKDYIRDRLEEDTHVYLRYDFDNPNPKQALQVLRHSYILGYIEPSKAEIVHKYLRESKIGAIVVSKIKSKNFTISIDLDVYYEDPRGEEFLPYYPLEGRQLDVIEVDLWTGQEDWGDDWLMNPFTDELSYKFNEMYDDDVDESEKTMANAWFWAWCRSYFDGTCITKKGSEHYVDYLTSDNAKEVLRKRISSYMENKCLHFAEKEIFSDLGFDSDSDSDKEGSLTTGNVVKQYVPTYEISYIDGQDKRQNRTIKNANMNSFIAGIKYRDNYEEMLSKLSEGMEVQLRKDPDNPYDPDAIAVYNGNDHLGYIPKRDIPAIVLNMEDDSLTAEIDYVDEENVDLVVPVTFERILAMSDDDLEGFRFYKTERTKYETGYQESKSPITKEEFVEGIRQQKHQYV